MPQRTDAIFASVTGGCVSRQNSVKVFMRNAIRFIDLAPDPQGPVPLFRLVFTEPPVVVSRPILDWMTAQSFIARPIAELKAADHAVLNWRAKRCV